MDKNKTPSDRALRSNHPRKKLRKRSVTPKSKPESSVTASKSPSKMVSTPKKKCQEKLKDGEAKLKAQNQSHIFKTPFPLLWPNQNRPKMPMPSKCYHCTKEKDESELIYVFPTKSGNKKFCSVRCLESFRVFWNNFQVNNYF